MTGPPGARRAAGIAPLRQITTAIGAALVGLAGCAPHPAVAPVPLRSKRPPTLPPATLSTVPSLRSSAVSQAKLGAPLDRRRGFTATDLTAALAAFRASCPALVRRSDASGLTQGSDWAAPCAAAATTSDPRAFFRGAFVPVVIGGSTGLDTGYYEPDLLGSPTSRPGYVPIYRRPSDLVDLDLGTFDAALAGKHVRGRIAGNGAGTTFVPYFDRGQIDDGALAGRGLELAWAADRDAAFFLEIQGSGRLRLADGSIVRVGYDGQNGHAYTGIGKLLRDRGALGPGQATMAGIIAWLRAHPAEGRDLLRQNRSKVFFKRLDLPADRGPPGALGVSLTARTSVAVDPAFVPLGAPLWLETSVAGAPFRTVVIAQDSGGAIKGANRLDLFWGSGDAAGAVAGGITATGDVMLLLPPVSAARLVGPPAARSPATPSPAAPSYAAPPPRP